MNDNGRNVVIWIAGFAGVLLLYSAYKGKNPVKDVLAPTVQGAAKPTDNSNVPTGVAQSFDNKGQARNVYSGDASTYRPGNVTR